MSDDATRSGAPEDGRLVIIVLVSGDAARTVLVPPTGSITFGRDDGSTLAVEDASVSRAHARIHAGGRTCLIEDLGSRNGTRVRGVPIRPNTKVPLSPGDVIECGDVMLLLRREPASTRIATPAAAVAVAARPSLVVGADARWFEASGERIEIGRRGALRRVLYALTSARLSDRRAQSVDALFEAGWPGERIHPESASARVYTAIQRLRALGLDDLLVTQDDGYLLAGDADVRWA